MYNKPLHIGLFSPALPREPGANGIVTYVQHLRSAVEAQGHRVTIFTPRKVERSARSVVDIPVTMTDRAISKVSRGLLSGRYNQPIFSRRLSRAIAEVHQADPLDVFELEESYGLSSSLKVAAPMIVRLHGPHYLGKDEDETGEALEASRQRMEAEREALAVAPAITSPSARLLEEVLSTCSRRPDLSAAIPNPMPIAIPEDRWSVDKCRPSQILCVGRFDARKGADISLEAFTKLLARVPEATLVFAGTDRGLKRRDGVVEHYGEYAARVLSPAIRERITFLGLQSPQQVAELRLQSGALLVSSRFECLPYSVAEAIAIGMPCVVSDSFGNAELVEDGVSGFVVPVDDASAAGAALTKVISSESLARRMGDAALVRATAMLEPSVVAAKTIDFYRGVIAAQTFRDMPSNEKQQRP